jgi:hypothetical protein
MIPKASKHVTAALVIAAVIAGSRVSAQQVVAPGGLLTGELQAMRSRDASGRPVNTFQLVSVPRKLLGPDGLCNLETGPETFQIVTTSETQASQLMAYVGRHISIRANEMSCAQVAGQMSDAIVSKWSLVASH